MNRWLVGERSGGVSNLRFRIAVLLAVWVGYALTFKWVHDAIGDRAGNLVIIPAVTGGLLLGLRAGLVLGLVAVPVVQMLFASASRSGWDAVAVVNRADILIGLVLGIWAGWLRDLLHGVRDQAGDLAIERQWLHEQVAGRQEVEKPLRQMQSEPEQRVRDRTEELERINADLQRQVLEHQRTEAELAVLGHRYQAIVNSMGEGILELDAEGRVAFINPAGARMLGCEAPALIGQPGRAFIRGAGPGETSDSELDSQSQEICSMGEEHRATNDWYCRKDGAFFPVQTTSTCLRNECGEPVGTVVVFEDISKQRQAQEELASEKERLAITLRSIGDGVIATNTSGSIVMLNPHAELLTGWTLAEAVGRDLLDVFPLVNIKTHKAIENPVARALACGQTIGLTENTAMVAKDGTERFVSSSIAPIRDWAGAISGVVMVFRDITRLKQAEEALRESREYARNLIASSLDMIIAVDLDRRIIEFNRAAEETFGYSAEQVLGKKINMLYAEPEGGRDIYEETIKRGVCEQEVLNRRKDGQVFPCFLSASVLRDGQGKPVGLMGVSRDITERKLAEERNIRAQGLAALGRLAAALAHEINNPLQTIQGMLDLVLDFPLGNEERERNLRVVRQEIERLTDVTGRVLQFARPAKRPRHLVSIANLVEQTLMLAGKQLQHAKIQTTTDLQDLPLVPASPEQLTQVFLNLLLNAIEALEQGGRIHIATHRENGRAVISFSNDGPPIRSEDIAHIFEPFFTTKEDGTGLGLSVSHGIIQQHGGDITVKNLDGGRGVEFVIQLPVAQPAPMEKAA